MKFGIRSQHTDEQNNQKYRDACDGTREGRERRVAELREQVRSGTYEIPFAQLVRILTSAILRRR